jgi:hypothetical protein
MKAYEGMGVYSHIFLNLGTIWRWVISFTPRPLYSWGKSLRYPLDIWLGGPQSRSGRRGEDEILDPTGTRIQIFSNRHEWGTAVRFIIHNWLTWWPGGFLDFSASVNDETTASVRLKANWNKPRQTGGSNAQRILNSCASTGLKRGCKHSKHSGGFVSFWNAVWNYYSGLGHAIAQAVSRWLPTAVARVQNQV